MTNGNILYCITAQVLVVMAAVYTCPHVKGWFIKGCLQNRLDLNKNSVRV